MASVSFSIRDRSDEKSAVTIPLVDITAISFAAAAAQIVAIEAAIAALTVGTIAQRTVTLESVKVNDVRPANPYAQREMGLRLFYQDSVTQERYHITVPCPDLLLVSQPGTDDVDLSGVAVVNALVAALEAAMVSRDGNPVDFYKGTIVGRRN
jgi:hypothetical protein